MPTPERKRLELKAAAKLEQRRRVLAKKTVYGIFRPGKKKPKLLRCIQEIDGEYQTVDGPYSVMVPEKLERFVTVQKRFKIAFGGRSGTKSFTFADILTSHAKDYGDKTLCVREIQSSIEDSVHALLKAEISRIGFDGFDVKEKSIRRKGEDVFKFRGLWRNPDTVKSMFGFKRAWGEEAQSLSFDSISMLTPTIREAGSECWFSLNPGSSADPMSQRFLKPFYKQLLRDGYYEDDLHLIVWINYTDNPWHLSDTELDLERVFDEKNLSPAGYRHKWLGHYNDEVDNSIIPVEHFDAAIDAHKILGFEAEGARVAAHDPSDLGPDDKGYALRHGSVVLDVTDSDQGDVNEGMDWALKRARGHSADWFVWDADGLGASLKRQANKQLKGTSCDYFLFKGSEGVGDPDGVYQPVDDDDPKKRKTNKETLLNKRAQYYIRLADRFERTYRAIQAAKRGQVVHANPDDLISLSSKIDCLDELRAEVCRIPLKPNNNGKIQIMSKEEMAKKPLQLPSPNKSDSLMMLMYIPAAKRGRVKKIKFKGWG